MGEQTAISWTDHTFNPWIGCQRVSPGCQHCYAETLNKRWGDDNWGKDAVRRVTSDANWRQPVKWNKQAEADGVRRRVFCASMADVFEDRADLLAPRQRLFDLIEATPWLNWQLLTKRPENVNLFVPMSWEPGEGGAFPENVWIGCTVEDQERADERIPILLAIPAAVHFLSCEPLLGEVDITLGYPFTNICIEEPDVQWVIVGGESGAGHRPLNLDWARQLQRQCAAFEIPFFFKQVGGITSKAGGKLLDGREYCEFPELADA